MRLFSRALAFVKQRRLGVVIGKLFGLAANLGLLVLGVLPRGHRNKTLKGTGLKWAAASQRIGLVSDTPARNGLPMHAVALVVMDLRDRCIDRQLVKIWAAKSRDLRIDIRMNPARQ